MLWFARFLTVGWALGIAVVAESGATEPIWRDVSGGRIRSLPTLNGLRTGFTRMSSDRTRLCMTNTVSEAAMANNATAGSARFEGFTYIPPVFSFSEPGELQ